MRNQVVSHEEWLKARLTMIATPHATAAACIGHGNPAAFGAPEWLSLAAAPTFALMALLTSVVGGDASDMLCAAAHGSSPLTGMAAMYGLMSAFHLAPWLRLIAAQRSAQRS
jgi:hypothetical protein